MQITPRLHSITIPFTIPGPAGPIPRSVNVFLYCGRRITLIDSGVAGSEKEIFSYLQQIGRKPEEIDLLVLTHSHPDHIGAAKPVQHVTGCRILAHHGERNWIEDVELQERERPVPGFHSLVAGSIFLDGVLEEGERIKVDPGVSLEVLHTPGHSPGSISFRCQEEDAVLTGDAVLLPGDLPIFDDCRAAVASLERLTALDAGWLLSAWDSPRQGAAAAQRIADSLAWLERVRKTVVMVTEDLDGIEPMDLCRKVVAALQLPLFAVNPLVAKSFMSCINCAGA